MSDQPYEFWTVSWPVPRANTDGIVTYMFEQASASSEQDARAQARMRSQLGHATVTNRTGLVVATYVNGEEWRADTTTRCLDAAAIRGSCEGSAAFRLVFRSRDAGETVVDAEPYCIRHGLMQVEHANRTGTVDSVELEEIASDVDEKKSRAER